MPFKDLIESLVAHGVLTTPVIIDAFRNIDRSNFMLESLQSQASIDTAFPIGYGQTISQPYTVAFMLELLQPQAGQKILDIGSGSGWTTALLAHIVGGRRGGRVTGLEIVPELCAFGTENVAKYNFIKKGIAQNLCQSGEMGLKDHAPFDRILTSAALYSDVPQEWKDQLAIGGRIVAPIGHSIVAITKKSETEFQEQNYPGFVFVPFVTE